MQETETVTENASLSDHLIEIPSLVLLGDAGSSPFQIFGRGFSSSCSVLAPSIVAHTTEKLTQEF